LALLAPQASLDPPVRQALTGLMVPQGLQVSLARLVQLALRALTARPGQPELRVLLAPRAQRVILDPLAPLALHLL